MIVYYKTCPVCYELLPAGPMIIRDTEKHQILKQTGRETHLMPGDTLVCYCGKCKHD